MRYGKALILGTVAVSLLAGSGAAVLSALAGAGAIGPAHVGLGPLVVVSVRHVGDSLETTLGAGFVLLGIAGGLLNAAVLALRERRERRRGSIA